MWSEPLPPRRARSAARKDPKGLAVNPNACLHCGVHCPPGAPGTILLPDGRSEHFDCWLDSTKPPPAADLAWWTSSELERRAIVEAGGTVAANRRAEAEDHRLIAWALRTGRSASIGRDSDWGNEVVLPRNHTDEQRAEAIRHFREVQLPARPDLIARLPELRGKVLVCWCHPKPCHGDVLIEAIATHRHEGSTP